MSTSGDLAGFGSCLLMCTEMLIGTAVSASSGLGSVVSLGAQALCPKESKPLCAVAAAALLLSTRSAEQGSLQ